jgi:hypothetical protein
MQKVLDKILGLIIIALTLNQIRGPVYLLNPTHQTPPKTRYMGPFFIGRVFYQGILSPKKLWDIFILL